MNRSAGRAAVIGRCASWYCVCGNPIALQGRSGPLSGPSRETSTLCPQCERLYFVIPHDRSFGAPVEVVELLGLPEPENAHGPTPLHADAP